MPMTPEELADHAGRLRDLLEAKRHLLEQTTMGPVHRAHLLVQVEALEHRVDQIMWTVERMLSDRNAAALDLPGGGPGIRPLADVVPEAEPVSNFAPPAGQLLPEVRRTA